MSDKKKRKRPAVSDWLISLVFKNRINLPGPVAAVTAAAVYAAQKQVAARLSNLI
jgi:hypothetical protein